MGLTVRASVALVVAVAFLAGCSGDPAVHTDPSAPDTAGVPHYLNGVSTEYSVPLSELGDVELLGEDSVMRDALIAGDEELLLAATAFCLDGVMTLDLVVLNRSDASFDIARGDLHVFDASGRLVPQVEEYAKGIAFGLRGRGARESDVDLDGQEVFGPMWGMDAYELGLTGARESTPKQRNAPRPPERREETKVLDRIEDARPIPTEQWRFDSSPRSVRVQPEDGKVFWAYFEGDAPKFPLTAMVLIDEQQYLFRFDR